MVAFSCSIRLDLSYMETKIHKQLEKAKAHFYLGQMVEAYNLFRRYFDRLPFKPEKGHAQYIGIFARVLLELGKEYELKFYMVELERLYARSADPAIAYPLAVAYAYLSEPKLEAGRALLEKIVKDPSAKDYHAKAKMMLADYYLQKNDLGACRRLIESIDSTPDRSTALLVDIWKALVCRRERNYAEARRRLDDVLAQVKPDTDWYVYFSAQLIVAMLLIEQKQRDEAKAVVDEVRGVFAGRHFKSVQIQLEALEKLMEEKNGLGTIRFCPTENRFNYDNRRVQLKNKSPSEKLLVLLFKKRFIDKPLIVKNLYGRHYGGGQDDKLIYYHIHTLRKRLKALGLPADAIASEGNGYRLVPEVEMVEGEL